VHVPQRSPVLALQVERLARKFLRRPVVVTIGTAGRATDNVTQRVYMVKENEKASRLQQARAEPVTSVYTC
jgi:superfamily II DNA/RNA helicase